MALKEGDKAPPFALQDPNGKTVSLSDFNGKTVVLYFYPKDFTPGCTDEACSLRDSHATISKKAVVIGISTDPVDSHKKFAKEYKLPFLLLSDPDAAVARSYDSWGKKTMYGKEYMGMFRKTFIISPDGRIKKIFEKVNTKEHGEEVLQLL